MENIVLILNKLSSILGTFPWNTSAEKNKWVDDLTDISCSFVFIEIVSWHFKKVV